MEPKTALISGESYRAIKAFRVRSVSKFLNILIALSFTLGICVSTASAQRLGLSQLTFDENSGGEAPLDLSGADDFERAVAEVLSDTSATVPRAAAGSRARLLNGPAQVDEADSVSQGVTEEIKPAQSTATGLSEVARAVLPQKTPLGKVLQGKGPHFRDVMSDDGRFIIPNLKGPLADKNDPISITTEGGWASSKDGGCTAAGGRRLQDKVKALREILARFTGSEEYYESRCEESCPNGKPAILTGLSVVDGRGGTFEIFSDAGTCRYRLRRPEEGRWLMLEGRSRICSCQ